MKKILLALAAFVVLVGTSFTGILIWANLAANQSHNAFFEIVATNDPDQFLDHCDESLKNEIDRPVLDAWMSELNASLGQFQGTSGNGFRYNVTHKNGVRVSEASGVAKFANGTANTDLTYVDGKLVGFSVDSGRLADGWFTGPSDVSLYQRKTEKFFDHFMSGEVDQASEMMHESLRSVVSVDSLKQMSEKVTQWSGPSHSVKCIDSHFDNQDGEILKITAVIEGENGSLEATTEFQFIGMKAHLIAFNVSRPE